AAEIAGGGGGGARLPALLALSLSPHDYVLHLFGPHSWEAWDELLRLDRALGVFLGELDRLFGRDGYAVMLTGDHGSNALPELAAPVRAAWCRSGAGTPDRWQRPCKPGRRLLPADVVRTAEAAAEGLFGGAGAGPFIAGLADPLLFFSRRARALPPADRQRLVSAVTAAMRERFDVADVVDVRAAPATCPPPADDSRAANVCRSIRPDGPGDLYLVV